MTDEAQSAPRPQDDKRWDLRWIAYMAHLKIYPSDANSWRVFYAGCEATLEIIAKHEAGHRHSCPD